MGIANCIGGRVCGVSPRSNRRHVLRPARTTVLQGLENLETRQVLSALHGVGARNGRPLPGRPGETIRSDCPDR